MVNQYTMNPSIPTKRRQTTMKNSTNILQKLHEEADKFQKTMEELYLLRSVAEDLRNIRKMIKLRKWD